MPKNYRSSALPSLSHKTGRERHKTVVEHVVLYTVSAQS